MIKTETRLLIISLVNQADEGISLTSIHNKVQRLITRVKLRYMLSGLYQNGKISRERVLHQNRRETRYYPFSGKPPVSRVKVKVRERDKKILSMKDFMPGKKYRAFIEP